MATIVNYSPQEITDKALFNFDEVSTDLTNYKLSGVVTVSVSQPFTYSQYLNGYGNNLTWSSDVAAVYWNANQVANINSVLATYSSFANISFSAVVDSTQYSPVGVGVLTNSDINISLIYRTDLAIGGLSSLNINTFGYVGGQLDIVLNVAQLSSSDYTLGTRTYGGLALMHEIGHSLGLSHPHYAVNPVTKARSLTGDFSATSALGFSQLGFVTNTASSMDKEYFTIMSYDNELPSSNSNTFAQTPMILDVIALQRAYGEGSGSSDNSNHTITPGSAGFVDSFRTYFDTGGTDTVDLTNYSTGAYLNLGVSIVGVSHLVGVSMNISDYTKIIAGANPESLRWFYGEFESAIGSAGNDLITGNNLDNTINGSSGDDTLAGGDGNDVLYGGVGNDSITGNAGNDTIDGGTGIDTAIFSGTAASHTITIGATSSTVADRTANRNGTDTLSNVERLSFTDTNVALDTARGDNASKAYRLYKAAFNRTPDAEGLGFWIKSLDNGNSLNNVSQGFIGSPEFQALYGANSSDATLLTKLYTNVLGRNYDQSGYDFWLNGLKNGLQRDSLLSQFSESVENSANVAPLIGQGIQYKEWLG